MSASKKVILVLEDSKVFIQPIIASLKAVLCNSSSPDELVPQQAIEWPGFVVIWVTSVAQARNVIALQDRIDLVLADQSVEGEESGVQIIKEMLGKSTIAWISGGIMPTDLEQIGVINLRKPFRLDACKDACAKAGLLEGFVVQH